jgi:hypothetical protein
MCGGRKLSILIKKLRQYSCVIVKPLPPERKIKDWTLWRGQPPPKQNKNF